MMKGVSRVRCNCPLKQASDWSNHVEELRGLNAVLYDLLTYFDPVFWRVGVGVEQQPEASLHVDGHEASCGLAKVFDIGLALVGLR